MRTETDLQIGPHTATASMSGPLGLYFHPRSQGSEETRRGGAEVPMTLALVAGPRTPGFGHRKLSGGHRRDPRHRDRVALDFARTDRAGEETVSVSHQWP